jgi:signal transduction histidine kinase
MLQITVLVLTAVINLLLGLIIYLKNPRGATNRYFFMLTIVFVLWSLVNYISLHPVFFAQLIWIRLVLFCGGLLNLSVLLTFLAFPAARFPRKYSRRAKFAVASTVLIMLLTLTPFVFKSLKITHGKASPVPAPGIGLFLIQTIILVGASIITLITKYRTSRGPVRDQLRLVLLAVAGTFTLIVISNFLLVVLFKVTALVPLGPAFTLIFSFAFAYAIARHKLFDIRASVARSVAYLLTILTITTVYGLGLFGVIDVILKGANYDFLRQIFSVILLTPLILIFQTTKRTFDRITNRLFFRDAYDTQDVLDSIGDIAISKIDLYPMLKDTREVLDGALRSSFLEFLLYKEGKFYYEGHSNTVIPQEALRLSSVIKDQHADLVDTEEQQNHDHLHHSLVEADVALSVRLKTKEQIVGFIVFGPKKGGDIYTSQDKKLLLIVAKEMAIAIQNAIRFEEIRNFNLTLQANIDEATRKLRHANEKLKSLDETKDDFISMASHQLRTPLTSIKGYISMVLEEDAGTINKTQKEMLGQAFFSSQRMVYLIADLLNISRLKTGKFVIERAKVNLAEVVKQELSQLQETAASRSLTLTYDKPKNFPELMLDETKTRQVIMNFVDNAVYYTPANGHINVRLIDKPGSIELRVEDDGIGVPKSEQHHLFTKFYRAGNARKARPDGTGLGLFMAKKVIVAQGGSIVFDSHEGKGSTFGFLFSKAHLKAPKDAQV